MIDLVRLVCFHARGRMEGWQDIARHYTEEGGWLTVVGHDD